MGVCVIGYVIRFLCDYCGKLECVEYVVYVVVECVIDCFVLFYLVEFGEVCVGDVCGIMVVVVC